MKTRISYTFTADDHAELEEHLKMVKEYQKMESVLRRLQEEYRKVYKYGDDIMASEHARVWSEKLHEILNEYDVTLD